MIRKAAEEFLPKIRFELDKEHKMVGKAKQLTELLANEKKFVDNRN